MQYIFIAMLSLAASWYHDFHVSITTAEFNPRSGSMEISMKVFTDDLEMAVMEFSGEQLLLESPNEHVKADSLIARYIFRNFVLKSKDITLKPLFVGKELENGILFIYLEIPSFPDVKEITVRNTVFFDRFDDQSNIVNMEINGQLQSAFLNKGEAQKTLRFD